ELENGTDSPNRIASKKSPGYHGLNETRLYRRHFPDAQDMRVLTILPASSWIEAMQKAIRASNRSPELWLFCNNADLTPEKFLHCPIIYGTNDGSPRPLIRPPEPFPMPG